MSTFGELLKIDRERLQLSQEQLAKMLDVSQQAVANWENGTSHPRKDRRVLLLQVLGSDSQLARNPPTTEFVPAEDMPADLTVKNAPDATIGTLKGAANITVKATGIISRATVGTPTFTYSGVQPWVGFSTAGGKTVQGQAERTRMLTALQDALPEQYKAHVGSDMMFGQVARQFDYASKAVVARVMRAQTASSLGYSAIHVVRLAMAVRENEPSHEPTASVVLFILSDDPAAVVTRRMGAMHFDAMTLGIKVEVVPDVKTMANTIVQLELAYAHDIGEYNAWMIEMHRRADEQHGRPYGDADIPPTVPDDLFSDTDPNLPEKGSW